MASRRRRRKGIGKVLTSVERKVRRIEKRPGAKRLKRNVVTTEKILPRAIVTKKIATDAVTANEAEFGVTVVTDTEPTEYLKEGTTWVNPDDGATAVYSTDSSSFVTVTDTAAQATADGKNTIFRDATAPTGGTYTTGDIWFDTDDNNKIYRFNGTNWSTAVQLGGNALANVNANTITAGTIDANVITVSNINAGNIASGTLDVSGVIKISSSPAATGNTARIEISSAGFAAYNGSTKTVDITSAGNATFTGNVTANSFIDGTSASTVRAGAAEGTTALQPGNGVEDNASDQITSISTAGIRIGTNPTTPSAADTTARVEINSGGFFAYNGSIETVGITSAGNARFRGNVTATAFSTVGGATSGITVGSRESADTIEFFRSSSTSGYIYAAASGFAIYGPGSQNIIMPPGGSIQLRNAAGTQGLLISSGSTVAVQENSSTTAAVRNIEVTTTATSHNDSASGYLVGDVRLVRQS